MDINFDALIGQEVSDAEIAKLVARSEYALGWMQVQVVEAKLGVVDKEGSSVYGCLQFNRRVSPLAEHNDTTSGKRPYMFDSFFLPFGNPQIPGHKAPAWTMGLCMQAMNAMYPDECPLYPRKANGVLTYNGEEISSDQEKACRLAAGKALINKLKELMADPDTMVGQVYYAENAESVSKKDGKVYRNLSNHTAELPSDAQLLQGESLIEEEEVEVPEVKAAKPKANGKTAPVAKKGKK
jgi:hypothetical protein